MRISDWSSDVCSSDLTTVDVVAPVRRINIDSRAIANGASPEDAMETWLPDMFVEDAQKGRFIQRQGASLSLRAYGLGDALRANPYRDRKSTRLNSSQ